MRVGSGSTGTRKSPARRARAGSRGASSNLTPLGRAVYKLRFLLNPKILIAFVALWIVYEGLLSQHSVLNLYKFGQERDQLKQELAAAEAKRDSLKKQIGLLQSDDFTMEKLAREKMGLAREGEIIYRYEDAAPEDLGESPLNPPIVDEGEEEAEKPADPEGQ
jgi:cell division protein FtsB